jgi:hypothetical protein
MQERRDAHRRAFVCAKPGNFRRLAVVQLPSDRPANNADANKLAIDDCADAELVALRRLVVPMMLGHKS